MKKFVKHLVTTLQWFARFGSSSRLLPDKNSIGNLQDCSDFSLQIDFNSQTAVFLNLISLTTRPSCSNAEFSLYQTKGGATFKPANISDISKITKSEHRRKLRRTGVVKTIKCNVKLAGEKNPTEENVSIRILRILTWPQHNSGGAVAFKTISNNVKEIFSIIE